MTGPLRRTLALAGLLALGGPACIQAQRPSDAGAPLGPGLSVPFVAQGPLLCGGAAAAMIERFWGALGVYASDYEHLVSREDGGIRTGELARALEARGHRVEVLRGAPEEALERVRSRVPVMALMESGESRYHYVVIVAAGPDRVELHDPLRGPSRAVEREEFLGRWAATDHWALVAFPAFPAAGEGGAEGGAEGGREASAPLPEALERALEALRVQEPERAVERMERYLGLGPASPGEGAAPGGRPSEAEVDPEHLETAWEMLATARWLAEDPGGALDAWNRVGRPTVDLVRMYGLRALAYRTVAEPLPIRDRARLTSRGVELARRRLLQLPAVRDGRVGYRPLRDGTVEVEVAVLERVRSPFGPAALAGTALGALVNDRAETSFGPLLPVGERWWVSGSWEEARPRVEGAVAVPWAPAAGVVTLAAGWMEERFREGSSGPSGVEPRWERRWARASLERWMTPGLRLGASAGVERWSGRGRLGRFGASALGASSGEGARAGVEVDAWAGAGDPFARARAAVRLRHRTEGGRAWTLTAGASVASGGSPPAVWDGAGTGRIRAPLLRGHRLVRGDRIGGDAFGRALLHATVGHAWSRALGPARVGVELFVDAARVGDPWVGTGPRGYLDPGAEARLSDGDRTVAVALARGGGDWVLSARVDSGTLPWLSAR